MTASQAGIAATLDRISEPVTVRDYCDTMNAQIDTMNFATPPARWDGWPPLNVRKDK